MRVLLLAAFFAITAAGNAQFKKLVWSDEFSYKGLPDSTKWGYDVGNHGWGNNELQYYTPGRLKNVRVKKGMLAITAVKESFEGSKYTSTRMVSKNKGDWRYGKIEMRAKLPQGRGVWPAFWMLPTDWEYGNWPNSGEIDIMEFVGYQPDSVYGAVHTLKFNHIIGTQKVKGLKMDDLSTNFHTYGIEWSEDKIVFFFDGKPYHEFVNLKTGFEAWPFDKAFHILLNLTVGGNWGGKNGVDDTIFPQTYLVDYVRVYQ